MTIKSAIYTQFVTFRESSSFLAEKVSNLSHFQPAGHGRQTSRAWISGRNDGPRGEVPLPMNGPLAAHTQPTTAAGQSGRAAAGSWSRVLAVTAAIALAVAHFAYFGNGLLDDAYITFRYIGNWYAGHGLVYNPGVACEGYTNFLWLLLLAAVGKTGVGLQHGAQGLGLALTIGTMLLVWWFAKRQGMRPAVGLLAMALLAVSSVFIQAGASGLETQLLTFLTTLAALLFADEMERGRAVPWSVAVGMLAYLTRPDAVLLPAALVLIWLASRKLTTPTGRRWLGWALLIGLGTIAAHVLWRHAYYGEFLPNTFYAKEGGNPEALRRGLKNLLLFVSHSGGAVGWPLVLLGAWRHRRGQFGLVVLAFICARAGFVLWSGGEWVGLCRFMAPVLPLVYILLAEQFIGIALPGTAAGQRRGVAFVAVALLLALQLAIALPASKAGRDAARALQRMHVVLGHDLAGVGKPSDSVATGEAGAIAYFSGLKVLDLFGLNDCTIARAPGPAHCKYAPDYVFGQRPRFFVIDSGSRYPRYASRFVIYDRYYNDPRFRRDYRFVREYSVQPDWSLWLFERNASRVQ